jgi:diguanylate cyclase (GGDEF)-like protein
MDLSDTPRAPDVELARRLAWFDRASELTGPMGTAAAAVVFALVARGQIEPARLWWWLLVVAVALVAMTVGWLTGRRLALGLPGHALAGLAWGLVLLLGLDADRSVDSQFLWICLAFQFATTAGVMSGRTLDDLLGRSVVVSMWVPAATILVVVGEPVLAAGVIVFLLMVFRDLTHSSALLQELIDLRTEETRRAERAADAALIDPLTGLLNRSGLEAALERTGPVGAAMFIDLDRFKEVNDRHGHHSGDRVLVAVADRLRFIFRCDDLVARLGGDEFLVVLAGQHGAELLADRAAAVIQSLEVPVDVDGEMILCSASVGVAEIPPGVVDAERVMRESDHAMYRAKRAGRRRAVLFGDDLRREMSERAELSAALRHAVRHGDIEVWGQPVVRLADSRVIGVELLARWRSAAGKWIPPDRFIPVAEEIGVSGEIARTVLHRAGSLFSAWRGDPLFGDMTIGINASAVDLGDRSFVDAVIDVLDAAGVEPERLMIEVTESISLTDDQVARRHLEELAASGITVALDDFGTGYSSISGLLDLPLGTVKVDRSLTASLEGDRRRVDVVRSIADLARTLGRRTVAEGVENAEQLRVVRSLGFDDVQGYYLCRPLPLDELVGWLRQDQLGHVQIPDPSHHQPARCHDQSTAGHDEQTPGVGWQ